MPRGALASQVEEKTGTGPQDSSRSGDNAAMISSIADGCPRRSASCIPSIALQSRPMQTEHDVAEHILQLERTALDRWGRGDPSGFLEISARDVSYFDPFTERRLDGLPALRTLYDSIRGKVKIVRSDIIEPRVQVAGDVETPGIERPDPTGRRGSGPISINELTSIDCLGYGVGARGLEPLTCACEAMPVED